ncbi:MAG: hypothetical protein J2P31_06395, partial [Blastocatellia bacterium]|nr:hypothetical protein [Blastocatellia bacterium]
TKSVSNSSFQLPIEPVWSSAFRRSRLEFRLRAPSGGLAHQERASRKDSSRNSIGRRLIVYQSAVNRKLS